MVFIRKPLIFLFSLFILFIPLIVEAAGLTFRVDPAKIRLIIPPTGSQAGMIKVYSQSDEKIKIKVYLEDWVYTKIQDGTKDFFSAKSTPLSCADWITFNPAEFILPPYGVQAINYITRIPADAKGGHYAVMFIEASSLALPEETESFPTEELRAGTTLTIRMGVLFYVEAKDTVKRLAQISNLSLSKEAKNKYILTTNFKNIGNVDITAGGSFHIIDNKGMVLARGEFDNVYTFPGDIAKLTATWKEPVPKGVYDLILTLDLGKALEELEMGRGPVITKEAKIEIDTHGEVLSVGGLK